MQQVVFDVYEEADVQAMVAAALAPWYEWSNAITDQVNAMSAQIADMVEINNRQSRRINALASRITTLEEQVAGIGTYANTY